MAMAQADPSHSVPQDLLPHVHLVSSYRYPSMPRLDINDVAKWLLAGPQVVSSRAPFFWTYLDKPVDCTILLTWQPLQRLGTNFATDGFVWAPPEQVYKHDLGNGLLLEVFYLKIGYIPGEQYTLHARRRFRLIPGPNHPNPHQIDPSLFIVHYGPSEQTDRIPVAMVPYDERVAAIMQHRHFLLRGGQIRRKEFMLTDRLNWPSFPELTRQQMGPQMTPRGVPQQMAYPPQPAPGPPAKRVRHAQSQSQQQPPVPGVPPPSDAPVAIDDEEDISWGDMFDHLTPRDISLSRYKQNHEWMEEIMSSAYRIGQIQPSDLNLGLKGPLASLTEGIFTAQGGDAYTQSPEKPYVGRLDAGLADEFRKRVEKHVESTQAEIKKLEEEHAETLAELKASSLLKVKEKELRSIPDAAAPDIVKSEDTADGADESRKTAAPPVPLDEIFKDVESVIGRGLAVQPAVKRVQEGGYQAPAPKAPTPAPMTQMSRQPSQAGSQNSGMMMMGDQDMDMGGTAAGLMDQMHSGFSAMSTPNNNNFPTPQAQVSAAHSNAPTPSNAAHQAHSPLPPPPNATAGPPAVNHAAGATHDTASRPSADVDMTGTEAIPARDHVGSAPDHGTGSGDWVVVPKGGASPGDTAQPHSASVTVAPAPAAPAAPRPGDGMTAAGSGADHEQYKPAGVMPTSSAATPAVTDAGSANFDQNDFSSLGDLDTAGDALAGFDGPDLDGSAGSLGDGLDLHMDMEDSAFGDAFHGVNATGTPGDAHNHDM